MELSIQEYMRKVSCNHKGVLRLLSMRRETRMTDERVGNDVKRKLSMAVEAEGVGHLMHGPDETTAKQHANND